MGPRPFSRGNANGIMPTLLGHNRFNGATTFQPWKQDGLLYMGSRTSTRFNGATTFQPWKPLRGVRGDIKHAELQWGHDLSAVETIQAPLGGAAVGWLQWGHDLSAVETRPTGSFRPTASRFNGATTFQPWKQERRSTGRSFPLVLQWGHDLSAVETRCDRDTPLDEIIQLQWGHDLSAVETSSTSVPHAWHSSRLQWGHDLSAVETVLQGDEQPVVIGASMGPRPFSRGTSHLSGASALEIPRFNGATTFQPWKPPEITERCRYWYTLQWGHDLSAVETRRVLADCILLDQLQWGHDLSAVETPPVVNGDNQIGASMGPRPFSRGNATWWRCCWRRVTRFNGATTFQPWKLAEEDRRGLRDRIASMGPRPFSRGNWLRALLPVV